MPVAADSGGPLWAPWHVLHTWSPFNIDALGLVTLLGAEEINAAVGRLVSSAYLEYLPLLGAYVIAGDRFTEKAAGWNLYNISQGIHTTDLAAWLTRWMLSQNFETTRNFVRWKVTPPRSRQKDTIISILISFILNGFLIAGTVSSADWYGLANALAMDVSILVRVYVVGQQRLAVDAMIDKAVEKFGPPPKDTYEAARYEYKEWKHKTKGQKEGGLRLKKPIIAAAATADGRSTHSDSSSPSNGQKQATQHFQSTPPKKPNPKDYPNSEWNGATGKPIKVLIIESDSKAVTFEMPNELVTPPSLFIEGPLILNPKTYFAVRSIGWLAFAVHIITIGMAILATQLYTIILIVLPTLLIIKKTGCDDSDWTPWLQTFSSWKTSLLHGQSKTKAQRSETSNPATKAHEFRFVRDCYIGSRLKAEVYEWPESYEFREVGTGPDKKWICGTSPPDPERSKKRQDLYAWLALTNDEEESMDKWDLFPHIRNDNFSWWETYKLKKHALVGKRVPMGPQHVDNLEKRKSVSLPAQDHSVGIKPFGKYGRTRTENFMHPHGGGQAHGSVPKAKPEHRQGSSGPTGGSSAFPAISAHESDNISSPPPLGDGASGSESDDEVGELPHIDTGGSSIDPSAGITQSPTVLNATDEQP